MRSLLAKHMLRPRAVEAYDATLNGVVSDLLAKLQLRSQQGPRGLVRDIAAELYRFGLEGEPPPPLPDLRAQALSTCVT